QFAWPNISITIRTAGDPHQLLSAARTQISAVDRDLPVIDAHTLEEMVDKTLGQRRETMYLVAGFALVALLLAAVGLYGVMAYMVSQRTTEIGIRQAIGAGRREILALVLGQGMRLTIVGIGIGVLAASVLTRLIARMLYHVSATDPLTFVAIS